MSFLALLSVFNSWDLRKAPAAEAGGYKVIRNKEHRAAAVLITLKIETACWREQDSQVLILSRRNLNLGALWMLILVLLESPCAENQVSRGV